MAKLLTSARGACWERTREYIGSAWEFAAPRNRICSGISNPIYGVYDIGEIGSSQGRVL